MTSLKSKTHKKQVLESKLVNFFENNYLDVQGINPGIPNLDEAYLARMLTKLAIGSATVWWSLLEIKDFISIRSTLSSRKRYINEISREDSF